jgi:hypothetical protein
MPDLTIDHKRVLAELLLELDDSVFAEQVVPDATAPHVQALLAEMGAGQPARVELRDDHLGLYGWPQDGVQVRIGVDGGAPRSGWRFREWPDVLLTAERHTVWQEPDGTLVDITPACTDEKVSLFVPDDSEPAKSAHFRVLYVSPDRSREIADRVAALKGGQRGYEERRAAKAGMSLYDWIAVKSFTDTLPEAIPAFAAACEAFTAKLARLPDLIESRPDDHDDIVDGEWHPDFETEVARDRLVDWHVARENRLADIEDGMDALGLTDTRVTA